MESHRTGLSDVQVMYEGCDRHIEVSSPDVSARGMFIRTPQVFPIGASISVRLRLRHSGRVVHLRGEVRYCLEGLGIVVEFKELSSEARTEIEAACQQEADW